MNDPPQSIHSFWKTQHLILVSKLRKEVMILIRWEISSSLYLEKHAFGNLGKKT